MTTRSTWNVKGVDAATKEAAKRAAEQAGKPLGDWLSDIIDTAQRGGALQGRIDEPLLLTEQAEQLPVAKSGTAAVEAVRAAIKTLLDRLQESQSQGALTLESLESSLRDLAGELESSQDTLAACERDQHMYLAGLSKDLFDLSTRVSLMENSRGGNTEAAAIQILEEAIGKITAFIEAADKRQTEAIASIGTTLDNLAGEVSRQSKSLDADRSSFLIKSKSADQKISAVTETSEQHHEKILEIQSRVSTVERRQSDNARLIEDKIDTRFDDLDENFTRLRDRLRGLEKRQAEETDTPVAAMEVAIDRLSRRIDQVETQPNAVIDEKIRQQESTIKENEQRMKEGFTAVTSAVEELADRISTLETGNAKAPPPKSGKSAAALRDKVPVDDEGDETPADKETVKSKSRARPARVGPALPLDQEEDESAYDENNGLMRYLFALILIIFLGTSLLLLLNQDTDLSDNGDRPNPGSSLIEFFRTLITDTSAAPVEDPPVLVVQEPRAGYQPGRPN